MVKRFLWHPLIIRFIGWVFAHMSFLIPVQRLRETETLMAFDHPKPSYPFHVLIVPKKAVTTLAELNANDTQFLADLYTAVQSIIMEYQLPAYRLIVNGGEFQDFPQLHFHLISTVARN